MPKAKKTILVACGTSIATTSIVVSILKEELIEERGFTNIEFQKCAASDLLAKIEYYHPDIIITTTTIDPSWVEGIPYFKGLPFLTGIGMESEIEKIARTLQEMD